ncbi:GAF domain-containing protein [Allosediminivita pacifica]|uniref:GAF domain-containing protein n=1 Tax=Allosediminivita pacifica TaxID=1267769 RepID=A0A2T6B133_9RHOB|nr:GAF domain-containing protein [Allosediminivita pacifica]PTX49789.1 GAF domain-containing protein [Allosediminivita pacifica]
MMDTAVDTTATRTFIEVSEVWAPQDGVLRLAGGNYGHRTEFEAISGRESFGKGEGLPGKAWAEGKPIVLKDFDGSYFKRTEAAKEAGLKSAVAVPVFDGADLKAVLVVLCSDGEGRTGAIEVWAEHDGLMMLDDGYYGAAKHFEWVSQHTHFPRGQGLPGGVWASQTPVLMRDLGSGYRFIRADSAGRAGLTTGLGLPVPGPDGKACVLTLLSARGTPIARRFEVWDARAAKVGSKGGAELIDGICEREGPLWTDDTQQEPRRTSAWQGVIGRVLGTGAPVAEKCAPGIGPGYASVVALPIHRDGAIAHIVAWYC